MIILWGMSNVLTMMEKAFYDEDARSFEGTDKELEREVERVGWQVC